MARNSLALAPAKASNGPTAAKTIRCAIYTRKSTEEGLQHEFNSLDAQREAGEAFVVSQKNEGWHVVADHFDDGGSNMWRAFAPEAANFATSPELTPEVLTP